MSWKKNKKICEDKGKCTVVQGEEEYEKLFNEILSYQNTYVKLSKDPTPKYKGSLIVDILKRLRSEDKIDEGQYRLLYPTAENIHVSPQVHYKNT